MLLFQCHLLLFFVRSLPSAAVFLNCDQTITLKVIQELNDVGVYMLGRLWEKKRSLLFWDWDHHFFLFLLNFSPFLGVRFGWSSWLFAFSLSLFLEIFFTDTFTLFIQYYKFIISQSMTSLLFLLN